MSAFGVFDLLVKVLAGLAVLVLLLGVVVDAGLVLLAGFLFIVAGVFYIGVRVLQDRVEAAEG